MDGQGAEPHKSIWIKDKGWSARDLDKTKGNLWLFAGWQVEQISFLWLWWAILQEVRAFVKVVANGWPSLECQSAVEVLEVFGPKVRNS